MVSASLLQQRRPSVKKLDVSVNNGVNVCVREQLLRKRHIGNDIVTIIFQEPGALPFTPKSIRSQFQHVFIIVRAHHTSSGATEYT